MVVNNNEDLSSPPNETNEEIPDIDAERTEKVIDVDEIRTECDEPLKQDLKTNEDHERLQHYDKNSEQNDKNDKSHGSPIRRSCLRSTSNVSSASPSSPYLFRRNTSGGIASTVSFEEKEKLPVVDSERLTTDLSSDGEEEEDDLEKNSRNIPYRKKPSFMAFDSFCESFRHIDDVSVLGEDPEDTTTYYKHHDRWNPFKSWSMPRINSTAYGCLSSSVVLTVRLLLDIEPTAYLIHSIIIFFDMILIHLFTNSAWLSISGEVLTIVSFLAFHYTKLVIFELLETTLIAVLCSFHLILSRNKHMDREVELEHDMQQMRKSSLFLIQNIQNMDRLELDQIQERADTMSMSLRTAHPAIPSKNKSMVHKWFYPKMKKYTKKMKICGEHFFEHFLDGSAGVMYTSFLGLILDEIIAISLGEEKK